MIRSGIKRKLKLFESLELPLLNEQGFKQVLILRFWVLMTRPNLSSMEIVN